MRPVLAIRFDVDSVTCIERGIPNLRRLADRLGIRFTFFVNMGHSFNWSHNIRHLLRKRRERAPQSRSADEPPARSLPTMAKLGWGGVLKTVALNPRLGDRYRETFDALHADGHELGLHGGTDHVVWQRSLDDLDRKELEALFRPAFEDFSDRYGRPTGFASPGFRFNDSVLELIDREGFAYASDMSGEEPFRPANDDGRKYRHHQVPVNVLGDHNVPVVEQGLARGESPEGIEQHLVDAITSREFALVYGHPYVEGVHSRLLEQALRRVMDRYDVVTVNRYLDRWKARHG